MTDDARRAHVVAVLHEAAATHEAAAGGCLDEVVAAADLLARALATGGKVLVFGNGGSAADAQHFVAELIGRYEAGRSRRALPALALSSDPSVTTALANDLGFGEVFARQVEALCRPGDLLVMQPTLQLGPSGVVRGRRRTSFPASRPPPSFN